MKSAAMYRRVVVALVAGGSAARHVSMASAPVAVRLAVDRPGAGEHGTLGIGFQLHSCDLAYGRYSDGIRLSREESRADAGLRLKRRIDQRHYLGHCVFE